MVEVTQEDYATAKAANLVWASAINGPSVSVIAAAIARIAAENAALEIAKEHGLMAVNMILISGLPGGTRTQSAKAQAFAEGYSQCAANIATAIRALKGPSNG